MRRGSWPGPGWTHTRVLCGCPAQAHVCAQMRTASVPGRTQASLGASLSLRPPLCGTRLLTEQESGWLYRALTARPKQHCQGCGKPNSAVPRQACVRQPHVASGHQVGGREKCQACCDSLRKSWRSSSGVPRSGRQRERESRRQAWGISPVGLGNGGSCNHGEGVASWNIC